MTRAELKEFFESEYAGKEAIFEKLIKPIFVKAKDTTLTEEKEIAEADKTKIKQVSIIAQVRGGFPITFADVELQDNVDLKRSRVQIQHCVRSIMSGNTNAIIFFHFSDSKREWRVSYCHKADTLKESTNAKRYTYLCGTEHKCRTIAERFEKLQGLRVIKDSDMLEAFSVEVLTKEFYAELFLWYEWACKVASFPRGKGKNVEQTQEDNKTALIRLITRLMFVWFIKQKDLIPSWIFDEAELDKILVDFDSESKTNGNYYNAVLQNLFFATLNKAIKERNFTNNTNASEQYGIKTFYRDDKKTSFFKINHGEVIKRFHSVPFLNGGLFECLDRLDNGEKNNVQIYEDGFSRESSRRAFLPNVLFFGTEKDEKEGLIHILKRYNFTVEENSPLDVQIALDPELLGKVFENLLGTYNPETSETARKDSGSFYTPREIVNFMVNTSIAEYLKNATGIESDVIEKFVNDNEEENLFSAEQAITVKKALGEIKILDPACGSGAFPMGVLNKLVELHLSIDKMCAETPSENNLYIKKGQCINYAPRGSELEIKAEYLGALHFNLTVNGKTEKEIFNSADLALHVKEIINEYNTAHGKKTIANLFSQGRIDNGESFNTIKTKREIFQIVDENSKDIIWQYKTYNVENKFRSYRNEESSIPEPDIDNDFEFAKYLYSLKKRIIQDSIFGVDIQPIAVQISKLRFFISLILEQPKTDNANENYGFAPLPNLETKIVAANSLIGLSKVKENALGIKDEKLEKLEKELLEIREKHFNASSAGEKKKYRNQDEEKRKEIIDYLLHTVQKVGANAVVVQTLENEIAALEAKIKNLPEKLVDKEQSQVDMFDNKPKTLFQVDINKEERDKVKRELSKAKKALEVEKAKDSQSANEADEA